MALSNAKVPVIVVTSIVCFALGGAGGVLAMMGFGYVWQKPRTEPGLRGGPQGGMPPGGMPFGNMPFGKMPFGKDQAPDPKKILATLIVKIDQLSQKPLKIDLNMDQQKKILEQLKGIADEKELSDEEATKKVTTLLEILKDHKETLEAGGFLSPDQQMRAFQAADANPLMEENTQKHLQSLQKALAKGKTGKKEEPSQEP